MNTDADALVGTMGSILDSLMALGYRMRLGPSVTKALEECSARLQEARRAAVERVDRSKAAAAGS